jgi:hypothetical protein
MKPLLSHVRALGLAVFAAAAASFTAEARGGPPAAMPGPVEVGGWQLSDAARITEPGDSLSQASYVPTGWHRATVPGTVLTSLVDDGVYPEPLYGENNRPDRIPDSLCRTSYWYRAQVAVPADYAGRQVWLNFEGINYVAEVWVNGQRVGEVKGAFSRGTFNVTPVLAAGRDATIAVHVFPQPNPGYTHEKTVYSGTGSNGGNSALDGPTFLCSIGWDWIPGIRDRDTGIWQKVTLSSTGPVAIRDPYVVSDLPLPRTDSADLTLEATVRNVTAEPQSGFLVGRCGGISFREPVSLRPNEARLVRLSPAGTPQLHVLNPRLWWPNGYGAQELYTLSLRFETDSGVSDSADVTFGIRKITYHVPGSENLTLSVNGVPVMAKGGDWGMDEAMKRIPRSRLEAQIRMHQLANYTMIRNWVGQSTGEDFYELCDKYGILLWDEFFQPNPFDGPDPEDTGLYMANVREKILRFRQHPSIALWCARNEGFAPPVIDKAIQEQMGELDPTRLYQPSSTSGRGVNSGGPYFYRPPRQYYVFKEAFKTEVGSVSVPTLEAVRAMMPQRDWESINDDWAEHDLCRGAQDGLRYPAVLASRFGELVNLPDFVRKAQLANFEAFRAMYEGRNAKLFHPCTGVLTWMSNPAQPSFVWQLYSYDLEPNSSLFASRLACEPVHIQMNEDDWHVMVVNNLPTPLKGARATILVVNLDGTVNSRGEASLTAAPCAATDIGAVAWKPGLSPVHFVRLELRDSQNRLVSENFYWRSLPEHPDDFQDLNRLKEVTLDASVARHDAGGLCLLELTLANPTKGVALMAHVQLRGARSGQRILPVYYTGNYVSLLPGESRSVGIEASQADLKGDDPLVVVDGWNTTVAARPAQANGAAVAPNTDAMVDPSAPHTFRYVHLKVPGGED